MKKAKLVILRHGQTEYNKNHLMTGMADVALTEVGEDQAREAGTLIAHLPFDKVYSSHLQRAFNTAALALKSAGQDLQIEQRPEIAELDTGIFTGRNHKTDPEIVNHKRRFDVPLPGGESEKQVLERVQKFFDAEVMPCLHAGENVLIVAHAGIVRVFDYVLGIVEVPNSADAPPKKKSVPNAAPTVYEYENGKMVGFYFIENPKTPDAANQNVPPAAPRKKQGPEI